MNFCEYCGKALEEGQVCSCEGAQKAARRRQAVSGAAEAVQDGLEQNVQVAGKNMPVKKLVILIAALLAVLMLLNGFLKRPTKVDWSKYITVNVTGVDSRGTAELTVDWNGLLGSVSSSRRGALRGTSITLDQEELLNNGDEITVTFHYDPSSFERSRLKVKEDTTIVKVKGLKKANPVDAFADLEVTFQGLDGFGTAVVTNHSEDAFIRSMAFSVEENQNLSNGQSVLVTVSYDQQQADDKQIAVPESSRTYTVSGLGTLVTSVGDLTEDVLEALDAQCRDYITTNLGSESNRLNYNHIRGYYCNTTPKLQSVELEQTYLCSRKEVSSERDLNNFVTCVYKIQAVDDRNPDGCTFYYGVSYPDLKKAPDGTITVDLQHEVDDYSNKGGESLNDVYSKTVANAANYFTVSQG